MFELRLNQFGQAFREAVTALSRLTNFANVDVMTADSPRLILSTLGDFNPRHRVLLLIHPSEFSLIDFDVGRSFLLDLPELVEYLRRAGDDTVTIRGADPNSIQIATVGPPRRTRIQDMAVTRSYDQLRLQPELHYQYYTKIGIPSHLFRQLVEYLYNFGEFGPSGTHTITVDATDTRVRFTTGNRFVLFRIEAWECSIWGVQPEHSVSFTFSLEYFQIFRDVCHLSHTVWLLHSDEFPTALNFPVDAIGNLNFYFHLRP